MENTLTISKRQVIHFYDHSDTETKLRLENLFGKDNLFDKEKFPPYDISSFKFICEIMNKDFKDYYYDKANDDAEFVKVQAFKSAMLIAAYFNKYQPTLSFNNYSQPKYCIALHYSVYKEPELLIKTTRNILFCNIKLCFADKDDANKAFRMFEDIYKDFLL